MYSYSFILHLIKIISDQLFFKTKKIDEIYGDIKCEIKGTRDDTFSNK